MNPVTCLQKLKYVGTLSFATVDRYGRPQVRCISGVHLEDDAIYFFTARGKDFTKELLLTGAVQILGLTKYGEMIRVSGTPRQLEGEEASQMMDQIFVEEPFLETIYPGDSRRQIGVVFAVRDMVIEYFNLHASPIIRECYALGNASITPHGYFITDICTECGRCEEVCPQGVIEEGIPYEIEQDHCLRCGACFEVCPVGAVVELPDDSVKLPH